MHNKDDIDDVVVSVKGEDFSKVKVKLNKTIQI